jgi:serine protease Do
VVRKTGEAAKRPARSLTPAMLGITLVPDVVDRTPPYVDAVLAGSPAAKAGIQPDDLVVSVGERLVPSCKTLVAELAYVDFEDQVKITVLRGQQLLEFALQVRQQDGK